MSKEVSSNRIQRAGRQKNWIFRTEFFFFEVPHSLEDAVCCVTISSEDAGLWFAWLWRCFRCNLITLCQWISILLISSSSAYANEAGNVENVFRIKFKLRVHFRNSEMRNERPEEVAETWSGRQRSIRSLIGCRRVTCWPLVTCFIPIGRLGRLIRTRRIRFHYRPVDNNKKKKRDPPGMRFWLFFPSLPPP